MIIYRPRPQPEVGLPVGFGLAANVAEEVGTSPMPDILELPVGFGLAADVVEEVGTLPIPDILEHRPYVQQTDPVQL